MQLHTFKNAKGDVIAVVRAASVYEAHYVSGINEEFIANHTAITLTVSEKDNGRK